MHAIAYTATNMKVDLLLLSWVAIIAEIHLKFGMDRLLLHKKGIISRIQQDTFINVVRTSKAIKSNGGEEALILNFDCDYLDYK